MAGGASSLRRHLVPAFVTSIGHLLRSRALISFSARVQWGREIRFGRGTVVKAFAVVQSSGGMVSFGADCAISSFVHVSTGAGDVIAGDGVRIAPNCTLVGGTKAVHARGVMIKDQPEAAVRGIRIGNDVLIGAGSVILPGTRIERGAVIGAGSVVSGAVPEYAIVAGAPAQVIGRLVDDTEAELLVIGTHAREGVKGILLGNTSERLLHAVATDVLTMHGNKI